MIARQISWGKPLLPTGASGLAYKSKCGRYLIQKHCEKRVTFHLIIESSGEIQDFRTLATAKLAAEKDNDPSFG
jgi:hypothetical protein